MKDPIQVTYMGQYINSMFLWVSGWHLFQTKCSFWETKMVVPGKCIIWWREGKGLVWHKGILWRRRWYRWSPSISLGQPDRVASRWWINRQTTIATRKGVRLSRKTNVLWPLWQMQGKASPQNSMLTHGQKLLWLWLSCFDLLNLIGKYQLQNR